MNFSEPLLIAGSSGTIGRALARFFSENGQRVYLTCRDRTAVTNQTLWLDLAQPESIEQLPVRSLRTAIICAAVTSHHACQTDYEATHAINVIATTALIKRLVAVGIFVVFISSNAVFDGTIPFVRADQPVNPKTAYGRQKAAAEEALFAFDSTSIAILRVNKVLHGTFPLFQEWVKHLGHGQIIHPFHDLPLAPIGIDWIVELINRVIQNRLSGVIQASADRDISYADAAYYIAEKYGQDTSLIKSVSCRSIGLGHVPRFTTLNGDTLQLIELFPPDPCDAFGVF